MKPNCGGKGANVEKCTDISHVISYINNSELTNSADKTTVVQEYIRSAQPHITRAEFIGNIHFQHISIHSRTTPHKGTCVFPKFIIHSRWPDLFLMSAWWSSGLRRTSRAYCYSAIRGSSPGSSSNSKVTGSCQEGISLSSLLLVASRHM